MSVGKRRVCTSFIGLWPWEMCFLSVCLFHHKNSRNIYIYKVYVLATRNTCNKKAEEEERSIGKCRVATRFIGLRPREKIRYVNGRRLGMSHVCLYRSWISSPRLPGRSLRDWFARQGGVQACSTWVWQLQAALCCSCYYVAAAAPRRSIDRA